jgi:hypothetical protein
MVYLGIIAGCVLAVMLSAMPVAAGRIASAVARSIAEKRK